MDFKGECIILRRELDDTVTAGDLVRTDVDTGHLAICAAAGTKAALGWALESGVDGDTIAVRLCTPNTWAYMTTENAVAVTQLGVFYALVGSTGGQMVDNNKTDADMFQLMDYDTNVSTTKAWVVVIPTCNCYAESVS